MRIPLLSWNSKILSLAIGAMLLVVAMPVRFWIVAVGLAGIAGLCLAIGFSLNRLVQIVATNRMDWTGKRPIHLEPLVIIRCGVDRSLTPHGTALFEVEVEYQNVSGNPLTYLTYDIVLKLCASKSEFWITSRSTLEDLAANASSTLISRKAFSDQDEIFLSVSAYELHGTISYSVAGDAGEADFHYRGPAQARYERVELSPAKSSNTQQSEKLDAAGSLEGGPR